MTIKKADLDRVANETGWLLERQHGMGPIDKWADQNEIDLEDLVDFVEELMTKGLVQAFLRAGDDGRITDEEQMTHVALLSNFMWMFHLGWEMRSQLGKPR